RTGQTYIQIQNLVALGQYALATDDTALAEQRLREALPLALAEGSWLAGDIYRFLTETLVRQGRLDDAEELAEFAARGVTDDQPQLRASVLLAEGAVAAAAGDSVLTADRYDEALDLLARLGLQVDLSVARITYGRALRELGELDNARRQLELVRAACIPMGAKGLAAEAARELALVVSAAG